MSDSDAETPDGDGYVPSTETPEQIIDRLREEMDALMKAGHATLDELARERARSALWREIAVAVREAGCSFAPVLWQSQKTELVRKLFQDQDEFDAEVDRRMAGKLRDLLLAPTAPPSDDPSTA